MQKCIDRLEKYLYSPVLLHHIVTIVVFSHSNQCSTTGVKKGCGMCYLVCGMMHIKEPLLLIRKSNPCGDTSFLSLSEWSFTICLTPHNRK